MLMQSMQDNGVRVISGGEFDNWDIEIRTGLVGSARLLMASEEHGGEKLQLRFMVTAICSPWGQVLTGVLLGIGVLAFLDETWFVSATLGGIAAFLIARTRYEAATASAIFNKSLKAFKAKIENGE